MTANAPITANALAEPGTSASRRALRALLRAGALAVALALGAAPAGAQDQPARPGSGERPSPPPGQEKATPGDDGEKLQPTSRPGARSKVEELVDDISDNMRRIEELLQKKETGNSTQSLQKSTIEKIDELIEEAGKT